MLIIKNMWKYQGNATITKRSSPEAPKEWEMRNYGKTNTTFETTDAQIKISNRRTTLEDKKNYLGAWGRGLKPFLLARKLTLYSDAAPNYKYMFGPYRGPLPHLRNITGKQYDQKHWDETKLRAQWRSEVTTQETHKHDHDEPDHRHW